MEKVPAWHRLCRAFFLCRYVFKKRYTFAQLSAILVRKDNEYENVREAKKNVCKRNACVKEICAHKNCIYRKSGNRNMHVSSSVWEMEKMDYQTFITFVMEMIGTVAFAASGAMVGVERKMDIFGVGVLGVVTAVGGGMIRDVTLGIIPPSVFKHSVYATVAVITSCLVFALFYCRRELLGGKFRATFDKIMLVMDSIGLGIFTVVGVNTGIRQGYADNTFLLVFVGTITGVGGGLLRDAMAGVPPYIFVRHIYACASIAGALVCVCMHRIFGAVEAMVVACIAVLLIRYLAAHYRWNLPRLEMEDHTKQIK